MTSVLTTAQVRRLPDRWRRAPARWGHPIHSLCSYFAMFPPQMPSVFIRWLTEPGDVVYDPFSGRGTAPFEAVLNGRTAYGSDANPLAAALTAAKVRLPGRRQVAARVDDLEHRFDRPSVDDVPPQIAMLYSPETLEQLVYLRSALGRSDADRFLRAMILGLLHGNHSGTGATRGLSVSMPNTFAMAPGYVRRYIAEHHLVAPRVDAFELMRSRLARLGLPDQALQGGKAWMQDATSAPPMWLEEQKARLIFTSPPYLEVIKYGKYNWVRLWFLGRTPKAVDDRLMATASVERYRSFMDNALASMERVLRADGYACFVIGDVRRRRQGDTVNLARDVWESVAEPRGWRLHAIVTDRVPSRHKVSRIWAGGRGHATKTDRIMILSRGGEELPAVKRMSWTQPRLVGAGG